MHRETGCAGVMIARGSFGQPWIFDQTRALLDRGRLPPTPPVAVRFDMALQHARMVQEYEVDPRWSGTRIPQAPWLVRERTAGFRRFASAAAPGRVAR